MSTNRNAPLTELTKFLKYLLQEETDRNDYMIIDRQVTEQIKTEERCQRTKSYKLIREPEEYRDAVYFQ